MDLEDCAKIKVGDRIAIERHSNGAVIGRVLAANPTGDKFAVRYKSTGDLLFPGTYSVGACSIIAVVPSESLLKEFMIWLTLR